LGCCSARAVLFICHTYYCLKFLLPCIPCVIVAPICNARWDVMIVAPICKSGMRSYASPFQTNNIVNTAIIPSLAYACPVVPCFPNLLNRWNQKIGQTSKTKFKLDNNPSTAMMRGQKYRFGLECPSITGEYHARCTEALLSSLNNSSLRHAKITKTLMQKQIAHRNSEATKLLASSSKT